MRNYRGTKRGSCMKGVMANPGFGDLVVHSKEGDRITIPSSILKRGMISTEIQAKLSNLTAENIAYLSDGFGIVIERASDTLAEQQTQEVI